MLSSSRRRRERELCFGELLFDPLCHALRLSFPRNDPLTPELCVRADGFADGARLRRHVCAVRSTAGARGFLVSARRRWELRFGELLLDPLYHAPTPFVSSEPCTNAHATPARGRVYRRRPSASGLFLTIIIRVVADPQDSLAQVHTPASLCYRSAERRKTCSHDMRLANQCNIIEIPSRTHHPSRLRVI